MHTDEEIGEFKPSAQGLHYHDVSNASSNIQLMRGNTSTRENFEGYIRHDVEKAREATHARNDCNPHQKGVSCDGA